MPGFQRAICIHGHFYQPPREDPITGLIPSEPGAEPYSNWNERIHAECYRPNAELGNFQYISFNFGPTLFEWVERHDPVTYRLILEQDQANLARYGVGNAIAQAYNHTILPLASAEDKAIQVAWGIADFQQRFGRKPEGMWLPETAVDLETLTTLVNHGLKFTILAPWQAAEDGLDPSEPYLVHLPDGRSLTVFFYQSDLSAGVSFNPAMTANADRFALHDLASYFNAEKTRRGEDQLLMLASDGELYGHHQPFRERFLSHLLNGASAEAGLVPTYPALWLQEHPARQAVSIRENTSWSCHHGITRWMGACACTPIDGRWKMHLRDALDQLGNALDSRYLEAVYRFIPKPRLLRKRYINVMQGTITPEALIGEMAERALTQEQTLHIRLLLEAQRERQRMFTSCGWFFDDFDRIEPRNNLAYAAHAVRLTRLATGEDLAPQAMADLQKVVSPRSGLRADRVFSQNLEKKSEISI